MVAKTFPEFIDINIIRIFHGAPFVTNGTKMSDYIFSEFENHFNTIAQDSSISYNLF